MRLPPVRQSDPVYEEQDARYHASLEESLDECRGRPSVAGPGCHLDQEVAPTTGHLGAQRINAINLVVPVHDPPVASTADRSRQIRRAAIRRSRSSCV